jgi:hypothetical protein
MKPISCKAVTERLWRYVDRELPASDLAAISAHVGLCESCRTLYHEKAREARRYREAFLDSPFGEGFVTKVVTQMRAESMLGPERRGSRSLQGGRFRALVGLAALLLLVPVLVAVVVLSLQPRPIGSFEVMGSPVRIGRLVRDGSYDLREVGASRGLYFAGGAFSVPEGSRLVLRPGLPSSEAQTTCSLTGNAFFYVDPRAERRLFKIFLQVGSLEAHVRRLEPEESYEVETPHATVTVVGTAFRLHVQGDRTVLSVDEGTVRLASAWPGEVGERLTAAGETWVARPGRAPERLEALGAGATTGSGTAPSAAAEPAATGGPDATASVSEPPAGLPEPGETGPSIPAATRSGASGAAAAEPGASGGAGHPPLDEPTSGTSEPSGAD